MGFSGLLGQVPLGSFVLGESTLEFGPDVPPVITSSILSGELGQVPLGRFVLGRPFSFAPASYAVLESVRITNRLSARIEVRAEALTPNG